jgi:hypothetical protein
VAAAVHENTPNSADKNVGSLVDASLAGRGPWRSILIRDALDVNRGGRLLRALLLLSGRRLQWSCTVQ